MNSTEKTLLALVRTGLWEQCSEDLRSIALSHDQWKELLLATEKQTVGGLVWKGLDIAAENGAEVPYSMLTGLAKAIDECEKRYCAMENAAKELFGIYEQRGLHPVLLKGHSIAKLYKVPQLRESGDIDIYFREEEFQRSIPKGVAPKADGSYCFLFKGTTIELHDHILDIEKPAAKKIAKQIVSAYGFDESDDLRTTSPGLTLLLLNAHILKHALGLGIGLRQICDYAVAHAVYTSEVEDYERNVKALGIEHWTDVLDCFCSRYLAMPCKKSFPSKTEKLASELLEKVLQGGNFGFSKRNGRGAFSTAAAMLANLGFSLKLSRGEAVWTFISLVKGRLS